MDKKDMILEVSRHASGNGLQRAVYTILAMDSMEIDGGPGSGNWGHKGRAGKRGGSGKGTGGRQYRSGSREEGFKRNEEARKLRSEWKEVPVPPKVEKRKNPKTEPEYDPNRVKNKYFNNPNKSADLIFAEMSKNKEETSSYETGLKELKTGSVLAGNGGSFEKLSDGRFKFWPDDSDMDPSVVEPSEAAEGVRAYYDDSYTPQKKEPQKLQEKKEGLSEVWDINESEYPATDGFEEPREWINRNARELMKHGVTDYESAYDVWEKLKMQRAEKPERMDEYDAVDTVRENIPDSILEGWFRRADSGYKPKLEQCILGRDGVLNAGRNIMYNNYLEHMKKTGKTPLSFEEFMRTPVTMYRGTHGQKEIEDDVFSAFSFDRKIAEGFGRDIEEISVRPIDTWGSYQTTGEDEVLVPRGVLKKIRR